MIDWNALRDEVHALQVERGAWTCPGDAHAPYVFNAEWAERHRDDKAVRGESRWLLNCELCQGTGKHRDVAEVVCDIHTDLSSAWEWYKCGPGEWQTAAHSLATAALRALDLAGYLENDVTTTQLYGDIGTIPKLFELAHKQDFGGGDLVMYALERLTAKLNIDLEAAIRAKLDRMKEGEEL